jgi:acetoacetyl-CoA synthetase
MSQPASADTIPSKMLWAPSEERVHASRLYAFQQAVEKEIGQTFADYFAFWQWSVDNPGIFWDKVWDFCGVVGDKGRRTLINENNMRTAEFFPDATINYAENLLRRKDDGVAIIFRNEKSEERSLTFKQLHDAVSRWQQALQEAGVGQGDRVAAYMPNCPETIIACLATVSLGAIFSSASPDFGVQGLLDRFAQIEPKVLIATDGYYYGGKTIDCRPNIAAVINDLPSIKKTVLVPFLDNGDLEGCVSLPDFLGAAEPKDVEFTRVPFNHPLFIMFSSGTTGKPKCIVHGHGGTVLQHVKELHIHANVKRDDVVFYFTTCGWMMWQWLMSSLACEATVLLYDGSPFYPDGNALWDFTSKHGVTMFGTSAKYIDALQVHNIAPQENYDLSALEMVLYTGSPLSPKGFEYVYDSVKQDVLLGAIAGGTDIISGFFMGQPTTPVYSGELQCAGLGMAVDVYNEDGTPIPAGAGAGELVCTRAFPSMPVMFWGDDSGERYHNAYFDRFDNIWCHGDWVERTVNQGYIIHGRSDATLNPGGVRIGTAEIYAQVEKIPEVVESIAVGQDYEGDVRVILFVVLKPGAALDEDLIKRIKTQVRTGASPRHVPAIILPIADIPRTKSGKITELAVRDVIHGRPVKNVTALANPEALKLYENLQELT